jgi:hypothetical protein
MIERAIIEPSQSGTNRRGVMRIFLIPKYIPTDCNGINRLAKRMRR